MQKWWNIALVKIPVGNWFDCFLTALNTNLISINCLFFFSKFTVLPSIHLHTHISEHSGTIFSFAVHFFPVISWFTWTFYPFIHSSMSFCIFDKLFYGLLNCYSAILSFVFDFIIIRTAFVCDLHSVYFFSYCRIVAFSVCFLIQFFDHFDLYRWDGPTFPYTFAHLTDLSTIQSMDGIFRNHFKLSVFNVLYSVCVFVSLENSER